MFGFSSWMSRSIAPTVKLPKMTAGETCTVVVALKTSHDAQPSGTVTEPVTRCMVRLTEASESLGQGGNRQLRRAQARAERKSRGSRRRADYNAYQRAWNALLRQKGVWKETRALQKLPATRRAALEHALPAEGLAFDLRSRNRALWNAGDALLKDMKKSGAEDAIVTLGGADVLAHLRHTHDELGAALGVSSPMAAPVSEVPTVTAPLAVVQELLREYVLKVYALLDPADAGSGARVGALLAPLFDMSASRAPKGSATKRAKSATKHTKSATKNTEPATKNAEPVAVVTHSPTPANDVTPAQRPTGTG